MNSSIVIGESVSCESSFLSFVAVVTAAVVVAVNSFVSQYFLKRVLCQEYNCDADKTSPN